MSEAPSQPTASRLCIICGQPIYRRPGCRTCSPRCRGAALLLRALKRRPCVVCGRPVSDGERPSCVTCSPECAAKRNPNLVSKRICKVCNQPIPVKRSINARTCSTECSAKRIRQRQLVEAGRGHVLGWHTISEEVSTFLITRLPHQKGGHFFGGLMR